MKWQLALFEAVHAPWKATREVKRIATEPLLRAYLAACGVAWPAGLKLYGAPRISRYVGSDIVLGKRVELFSDPRAVALGICHPVTLSTCNSSARLYIGDGTGMSGGTICAAASVSVGCNVLIGPNCLIVDSDFHSLDPEARRIPGDRGRSRPVVIEDDVFIGANALVLKGSHIGRGSVIGAGSVVVGVVPAGVIAAGNPARAIREVLPRP